LETDGREEVEKVGREGGGEQLQDLNVDDEDRKRE
jgi:hypothetical protein